jgi:hypothetical protein
MAELKQKVGSAIKDKITAATWIGAYRKAQNHENIYFEHDNSVELASSDDEMGAEEEALPLDELDCTWNEKIRSYRLYDGICLSYIRGFEFGYFSPGIFLFRRCRTEG